MPVVHDQGSGWITLTEAARRLGVSVDTIRTHADGGTFRMQRTPGGHRRVWASDVDSFTDTPPAGPIEATS